jgi:hypothetical protein
MKPQLPATDSISALARFWDSHDVTAFEDELEEIGETAFVRGEAIPVPLTPAERDAVRRMAAARGVAEAVLIHEWVKEKLHA